MATNTTTFTNTPTATATFTPTPLPSPFPEYDLTINQSATPDSVFFNQPLTYTLTVTNSPAALGGGACPNVRFGWPILGPYSFSSASGTNGYVATTDGNGITFTGGCVSSQGGVVRTATLTVVVVPSTTFLTRITSLGENVIVDPENNWAENDETNNTAATIHTLVNPNGTPLDTRTPTFTPTATATNTATFTPTATATPTIPASTVQFSSTTYFEDESQAAMITLNRTGDLSGTATVNFSTSNGLAIGGTVCSSSGGDGPDYLSVAQPVIFGPNETSKSVNVVLCGDGIAGERDETLNLLLTGANAGSPDTSFLAINDTATQFVNPANIAINSGGAADLYPSTINVANYPVPFVSSMRVTIYDYAVATPVDVSFLLVSPGGQKFVLLANAGGLTPGGPATLTFEDTAGQIVPFNGPLTTRDFEPTSYGMVANFPAPAPLGPYNLPGSTIGGTGPQMMGGNPTSTFGTTGTIGTWSLYVREQAPPPLIHTVVGNVSGWGLEFFRPTAQGSISGRVLTANGIGVRNAKIVITGNSLAERRVVSTGSFGYYSFDGLATGETYVVTVNSRRYTFPTPSHVISLLDSVAEADFIAEPIE